jgi:flagellar biosynthesis anti-sigma factor FlgM
MKINMNVNRVINIYNNNNKNTQIKSNRQDAKDKIEISVTGKEISKYIEQANTTEIQNKRVDEIKELIQQNKYKVDSQKLAEDILKSIKERDI